MDQHFKEKHIMNLANQPFAPQNIFNHLMESCGVFESQGQTTSMSSIVILDTNTTSDMFRRDELDLQNHLASISDHVLDFGVEQNNLIMKRRMPQLELRADTNNYNHFQTQIVAHANKLFSFVIDQYSKSSKQYYMKKELKIHQDPWENYLMHDSKHFIPLICHQKPLPIEKEVLVAYFIVKTVKDESISEYKPKGDSLLEELFEFAEKHDLDLGRAGDLEGEDSDLSGLEEEEASVSRKQKKAPKLLEKLREACLTSGDRMEEAEIAQLEDQIESTLKMFYLHLRVKGKINEFREDYFV
jgi:hypothetical protein